jgi:hypothetical protein
VAQLCDLKASRTIAVAMTDSDRFRLLGSYRTPRFRLGQLVADEANDRDVVIVGLSVAHIPWPIGKPRGERAKSLAVFPPMKGVPR